MKRLILLGGGHAHLFVLEAFIRAPLADVELVLVSPTRLAPYSGMMPGVIAGHYRYEDGCVDLLPLCRACGCAFHRTRATRLDPSARRIECDDGEALDYDLLSIDTGSTPGTFGMPGVLQHAHPVKPIDHFVLDLDAFCAGLAPDRRAAVAVVGAGAAGCEVILALQHRIDRLRTEHRAGPASFTLATDTPSILPGFPSGVRRRVERQLEARGVRVLAGKPAARVDAGSLLFADGAAVPADFIVWATGSSAPQWPRAAGLACDDRGFILVDPHLRSTSHEDIFAAGDIATMAGAPRPKSGVYAVRAGPPLARNLRAALNGTAPTPWLPQRRALALISAGEKYAVGLWGPFSWEGRWVWNWKDRIDRGFIRRFTLDQIPTAVPG